MALSCVRVRLDRCWLKDGNLDVESPVARIKWHHQGGEMCIQPRLVHYYWGDQSRDEGFARCRSENNSDSGKDGVLRGCE